MSKITLTDLVNLQNQTTAVNTINTNNAAIETAFDNTLSRDGTTPNTMGSNLDMNSYKILNLPAPTSNYEPLRLLDAATLNGGGTISISGMPAGGTTNQVLKKNSSTNFDTSWATISTNIPTGGSIGQVLTKNSSSDYDASWKSTATVVTPEQFGYTGSGDAGVYINTAINSTGASPVTVLLGPGTYTIITPILVTKFSVWIKGSGDCTILDFEPTSNNQTCITYDASPITTGIYYGRITDLRILSNDTTYVKTAINLYDVGNTIVSGVIVGTSFTDTATRSCVGLKTNGRQCSHFVNLGLFCDIPVQIKTNPNAPSLSADHFHFENMLLAPHTTQPCVLADPTTVFTNTRFDGYQAWVLGTYGFYWNQTSAPSRSWNLVFDNVRTEQGSSATAYSFYINSASLCTGLQIKNSALDDTRKGIYCRNVTGQISNIYMPALSAREAINIDSTCLSFKIDDCRWEAGCTQSIGALTTKYTYNYAGASATVPSNALYSI